MHLQLDIDVSMLLDGFGDSEQLAEAGGNTELLFRLLHAGMDYHPRDPADEGALPKMDVDEWSTTEDIEKARAIAERVLKRDDAAPSSSSSSSSSSGSKSKKETEAADEEQLSAMDVEFGGKVEETLRGHAHFTLSLLERLCFILSDTGMVEQLPESLGAIADTKALHTETVGLRERITKLSGMILELQSRLFMSEKQKRAAERAVDRATVDRAAAGPVTIPTPAPTPAATTAAPSAENSGAVPPAAAVDSAPPVESAASASANLESDGEMYRKIAILEKQLAESETAKAKAEMTLTERLARPLSQTEAQVADMRRAMEDLRHQGRQRVAALITEGIALQDRVADLEEALLKVEAISQAKCAEITAATEREIQRIDGEKKAAESALCSARAELATTNQLKHQVGDLLSLESTSRSECARLQQLIASLTASQDVLQRHLVATRTRECELEKRLAIDPQAPSEAHGGDKEAVRQLALTQAHARARETQVELDDARNQMNDLILEIESVTVEDDKSRVQSDRVLRQMTDSQSMQRGVLDENLQLHDQISELHRKQSEVSGRIDHLQAQLKTQDGVIAQLRSAEGAARTEIQGLRKTHSDEHSQRILNEQLVVEAEQKLKLAEHSMELAKKRNAELQTRCNELSGQMETERKARMDAQREMKLKVPKRDRKDDVKGAGAGAGGAESDMLEMTLGMLRCSVCKDRFKDCAITRCFHLFCKECIDENLRQRNSRHRKCPACGEKFSQEDVKSVFFTH